MLYVSTKNSRIRQIISLETRTKGIHNLLPCKPPREQPPGRDKQEVALQSRHPLVLGCVGKAISRAEWGARRGGRRVQFKKASNLR